MSDLIELLQWPAMAASLLAAWLVCAFGMKAPRIVHTKTYIIPALDNARTRSLLAQPEAQPGVHEVQLAAGGRTAYLKVDAIGFDEQHVLRLIAGET